MQGLSRRGLWLVAAVCAGLLLIGVLLAERASVERPGSPSGRLTTVRIRKAAPLSQANSSALDHSRTAKDFADRDGFVLWTLANFSWLEFVLNFAAHAEQARVQHFFVACLDDQLLAELQTRGINAVSLRAAGIGPQELTWGTDRFRERGRQKIRFTRAMLETGLQPLFLDLDAVLLGDPQPLLRALPEADLLISTDQMHPGDAVRGLEPCPVPSMQGYHMGMMNVGMALFRPGALPVLEEWERAMNSSTRQEQQVFNDFMSASLRSASLPGLPSPFCGALDDHVTLGLLHPKIFANGHLYYYQGLENWERVPLPPLAVHANYIIGRAAKRHYMREAGLWLADPPERFQPEGGFLSFTMWLPLELLLAAALPRGLAASQLAPWQLQGHVALLEHQLAQVRAAMQLAMALGRQLILPQLWCGPSVLWRQHVSAPPAATHSQPLPCPLGTVLDIDRWLQKAEAGELPVFHEHALLSHPLMQRQSMATIAPAAEETAALQRTAALPLGRAMEECQVARGGCALTVARNQSHAALVASLKGLAGVAVMEFQDLGAVLAEPPPQEAAAFSPATVGLTLGVCCAANQTRLPVSF